MNVQKLALQANSEDWNLILDTNLCSGLLVGIDFTLPQEIPQPRQDPWVARPLDGNTIAAVLGTIIVLVQGFALIRAKPNRSEAITAKSYANHSARVAAEAGFGLFDINEG